MPYDDLSEPPDIEFSLFIFYDRVTTATILVLNCIEIRLTSPRVLLWYNFTIFVGWAREYTLKPNVVDTAKQLQS